MTHHSSLKKVIFVDEEKCVNCHACITVCPVKFCNIDMGDHMSINGDLCIACGSCIEGCHHEARIPVDDYSEFKKLQNNAVPMVAIVAPAIAASFPNLYLNLNGYLKTKGIDAFFDVSFGAELTIKSYLNHIKDNPQTIIAQPCPAIVSYIETYAPELLAYLAPVHSPMMHTIQMIKHFYPEFQNHRIIAISPCLAKAKEFDTSEVKVLNVTFPSIQKMIEEEKVDLKSHEEVKFNNPPAERAVLFSTPGGLLQTALRENANIHTLTRKIEGKELVYDYLKGLNDSIQKGYAPLLIDCLNCEHGCNKGTATINHDQNIDETEYLIQQRSLATSKNYTNKKGQKQLSSNIDKYRKPGIYNRKYTDRSLLKKIQIPSEEERWEIFRSMKKNSSKEIFDCSSCGYGKCEDMATAIFNGLNKKENCHYYKSSVILELTSSVSETIMALNNKFESIGKMLSIFKDLRSGFNELENAFAEQSKLLEKFDQIAKTIHNVSQQTNILSLNASIEAARVGQMGKGFGVVATEIKKLSENTSFETQKISDNAKEIQHYFNHTSSQISSSTLQFEKASTLFLNVSEAVEDMNSVMQDLSRKTNEFALGESLSLKQN